MATTRKINESSVFLVSGGARGVTAQCVIKLAERYPCKLILLGRSPITDPLPAYAEDCFDDGELKQRIRQALTAQGEKPTPMKLQKMAGAIAARRDIDQTLQTLKDLGREVAYVNADVTNLAALQAQLMPAIDRLGAVTGIIHGAGNLADKLIENKTEQDFELVYTTKVQGLENLFQCVPPSQLSHLVLFSSVAGFYGSGGQSDYAIANEILNRSALLVKQHHPICHVVAVNWGPWDSGMVTPILKQAFMARNIDIIPLDVGASRLVEELADQHQDTVLLVIGSPLLPEPKDLDDTLQAHRIRRQLSIANNPFLQDYAIDGAPTLPLTCALSWMINTCEQLYPGYKFSALENFQVLQTMIFDGTQAEEFVVDVQEVAKPTAQSVVFDVRIWSAQQQEICFHYSSQVSLQQQPLVAPVHPNIAIGSDLQPDSPAPAAELYADQTLPQGRLFQGLQHLLLHNPDCVTAQCLLPQIPAPIQGQFFIRRFNPYAADLLMQVVQVWAKLQKSALLPTEMLPTEIEKVVSFEPLPFDRPFYVDLEREAEKLTVTAYDAEGKVYLQFLGLSQGDRPSPKAAALPQAVPIAKF